jgi:hypothetical protein
MTLLFCHREAEGHGDFSLFCHREAEGRGDLIDICEIASSLSATLRSRLRCAPAIARNDIFSVIARPKAVAISSIFVRLLRRLAPRNGRRFMIAKCKQRYQYPNLAQGSDKNNISARCKRNRYRQFQIICIMQDTSWTP